MTKNEYEILNTKLKKWQEAYENGEPLVTDLNFDYNYDKIKEYEKINKIKNKDSITQLVGVVDKKNKVPHKTKMLSIQKTYDIKDIVKFNKEEDLVLMPKFDGVAIKLVYRNRKLVEIVTRGDGINGVSIKHLINTLPFKDFRHTSEEVEEIIGELVISNNNHQRFLKWSKRKFVGQRSVVASSIMNKKNLDIVSYLEFIPFNLTGQSFSQYASTLDRLRYLHNVEVIYDVIESGTSLDVLKEKLDSINKKSSNYPKDGYVFTINNTSSWNGYTKKYPKFKLALKEKGTIVESVLLGVKWNKGDNGRVTPVGYIKPVKIDNVLITKVNLYTYKTIKSLGIAVNDIILVTRQGGSIPKIVDVIYDADNMKDRKEIYENIDVGVF